MHELFIASILFYTMKYINLFLAFSFSATSLFSQAPSKEVQISTAVQSLPEELQDGAKVWGFDSSGNLIELRKGTNDMVCLADDPEKKGFNSACYHKDLEEFMARGRALKAEGKNSGEIFEIREKEAKAGDLKMPDQPTTLHICYGSDAVYNETTEKMDNTKIRYVVYIPWATPESTGLPLKPMMPGGPWIMDPGTHRAHIMITPPQEESK